MPRRLPLAFTAVLGACYGPNAPIGVPCAMNNDCPSGQACNPETRTCEPPTGLELWRDDTAGDFGAAGALTDGAEIEPAGFVGPVAYFAGGVRLSGIDRLAIPDPATTWSEVSAAARTGTSFVRGLELDFGSGAPLGLGLSGGNNVTVLVEGEVYLGAPGAWRFQLTANDLGFLELAPPGGGAFQRVVTDQSNTSEGSYDVPAPGWYRLRGAFADGSGTMVYALRYDPPGPGNFRTIPSYDLRAPAGDVAGLIVDGFEEAYLLGPRGSVVHAGTLGGQAFDADPFGIPIGNSSYTLRFAGQVRIDTDGSYAFRIDSSQGHRAWLDGASVADRFGTAASVSVTPPVRLEPGWHDFVVDVNRTGGTPVRLDVTVDAGPAWVGQAIPLDHLRPVVGRATRWTAGFSTASSAIPDQGASTRTLTLEVPPDMVTTRIDASYQISHPVLSTMEVKLAPPVGATTTLAAAGSLTGSGSYSRHTTLPASSAGATWSVTATDTAADAMTGSLTLAAVTMIGSAGPAPFPTSYRYVSAPRELGDVASIAHVRWALRQASPGAAADGAAIVSLRTCDAAAACDAEPWTAVTQGASPGVAPRRFAQYMVELTSNGDLPTALDWIEIGYRTYAP